MNILVLRCKNDNEFYLEYNSGNMLSENNYIRENVQSNYGVDFDFKGIKFDEDLILEALSDHFDEQCHNNMPPISYLELKGMFDYHQEIKDTYEISLIKRICISHARRILATIDFM